MSRHEDHGRWQRQGTQAVCERQAVLAGHADVEQQQREGLRAGVLQHAQRLLRAVRFLRVVLVALGGGVAQQRLEPHARQGFVVNDQDVHAQILTGAARAGER